MVAAVTGGAIDVEGARASDMEVVASVLQRMQVRCDFDDARLRVEPSTPVGGARIVDRACGRACRAISSASSRCSPPRRPAARCCTTGCTNCACSRSSSSAAWAPTSSSATRTGSSSPGRAACAGVRSTRATCGLGMALAAAALAADGQSRLGPLETIERGYANLTGHLKSLGAQVETCAIRCQLTATGCQPTAAS